MTARPTSEPAIRVQGLEKSYKTLQVLRGVDFDVARGSIFALPFLSSAFVPTDTMPGPVRAFAEHQPVTSIVNAMRNLYTQQPVGTDIWIALAWRVGILIVAYFFATLTHRRKIS